MLQGISFTHLSKKTENVGKSFNVLLSFRTSENWFSRTRNLTDSLYLLFDSPSTSFFFCLGARVCVCVIACYFFVSIQKEIRLPDTDNSSIKNASHIFASNLRKKIAKNGGKGERMSHTQDEQKKNYNLFFLFVSKPSIFSFALGQTYVRR